MRAYGPDRARADDGINTMGDVARIQARTSNWVTRIAPHPDLPVPIPVSSPQLLDAATTQVSSAAVAWAAQVGAEAAAHIEDQLPLFGGTDHQRELLRMGTESATLSALLMLAHGPGEPPPLTEDATQAILVYVQQDVTLDQLLRGIRLGHMHMSAAFLAAAETLATEPGRTATVREVSARLFDHIDRFSRMAAEVFTTERDKWLTSESTARLRAATAILAGNTLSPADGAALAYALDQRHVAVIVQSTSPDSANDLVRPQRIAHEVLRRLGCEARLIVPAAAGRVWAWAGSPLHRPAQDRGLQDMPLPTGLTVAIGAPGAGPHGFRRSHLQALDVLRVDGLRATGQGVVLYEQDEMVALLSTNLPAARDFTHRVLGPLAAANPTSRDLRTTLKTYLDEHGSPVAAAASLHVARNTVSSRIQRAAELLDRDLTRNCLDVHLALDLVDSLGDTVLNPEGR
jgi:DNA-binding PucR family transcriptional regulator